MDTISQINVAAGILMAALCFTVLAATKSHEGIGHIRAFLLFWAINAVIGVVDRIWADQWEFYGRHASLQWAFDAISNMAVVLAAFSLYRGNQFSWADPVLHRLYYAIPVLVAVELFLGFLAERETALVWKLFYTTPGAFIATVALALVALAAYREPLLAPMRLPITVLFALYAYLQIPGYVCEFIEAEAMKDELLHGKRIIRAYLAATKIALSISLLLVLWSRREASPKAPSQANVGLSVMSLALLVFVFFYRVFEVQGLASIPTR